MVLTALPIPACRALAVFASFPCFSAISPSLSPSPSAACQPPLPSLTSTHHEDHYPELPIGHPGHPVLPGPRSDPATSVRGPPRLLLGRPLGSGCRAPLWLYYGRL